MIVDLVQWVYVNEPLIERFSSLLMIAGVVLSFVYVVGKSSMMDRYPLWRTFFVAQHSTLFSLSFASLLVDPVFAVLMVPIWALTLVALVFWHHRLIQKREGH